MIRGSTLKQHYVNSVRIFSAHAGKNTASGLNIQNPEPNVLPPDPSPSPTLPDPQCPVQTPVIEIPGPIVEPSLPQHQSPPDSKPPTEIPAPARNATSASMHTSVEDDVLVKDIGNKGVITLNRPKALNALNLSMVEKIYPILKKWETSKKLVIIEGAGEKAFCAGGDVKTIVTAVRDADDNTYGEAFFRKEYTINHLIGVYKIPYVALIHGIVMGGGAGLSVHGKYRVATETTLFAMPETGIGLFPDVGGTHFLPRLKGKLGLYLGLTGYRLKGIDVLLAGVATHFVPSDRLSDLKNDLLKTESSDVQEILNKYRPTNLDQEFSLAPYIKQIDKCFSAPTIEGVLERLKEDGSEWAKKTTQTLLKMSPTSLKVTMRAVQNGSTQSLAECLKTEFRLGSVCLIKTSDFCEGVRALLIDKDQNPMWKPKSISEVTDAHVNKFFAEHPPEKQLQLERE